MSETIEEKVMRFSKIILNSTNPVLMQTEFNSIISNNNPGETTIRNLKKKLTEAKVIKTVTLRSEGYKDVERIAIPKLNPSPYHYAVSLRKGTYLCHSSSINLLGLTQQIPKTIYVNKEQSPKKASDAPLNQEAIDRAFSNQQRRSQYIFKIDGYQIILLSGKWSNNLGVEEDNNLGLLRTSLERTLIDITVRPRYAGGVFKVLEAYKAALPEISFHHLASLLDIMEYKYPYHQAIGFYLEKAGAEDAVLELFRKPGIHFNFYLDYAMASKNFNESWKIFFPLGI